MQNARYIGTWRGLVLFFGVSSRGREKEIDEALNSHLGSGLLMKQTEGVRGDIVHNLLWLEHRGLYEATLNNNRAAAAMIFPLFFRIL